MITHKESSTPTSWLVHLPEPFCFEECLWFLDRNYDDCLHRIEQQQLLKAVDAPDGPLLFRLTKEESAIRVEILAGKASAENREHLTQFLRAYIDGESPLYEFYDLLKQDDRLAYMTQAFYGLRMVGIPDLFEGLVWSIIGQQINLSFAYRLKRRLVEAYGHHIEYQGQRYYIFPKPAVLANVPSEVLRGMQFSGRKASYIIGLAQQFAEGSLSKNILRQAPDPATRFQLLTDIRGVGAWTANYVLMKCMWEKDCIPYGDTGLTAALLTHQIFPEKPTRQDLDAFFSKFSGWQSYLVFYLWRSLSGSAYPKPA